MAKAKAPKFDPIELDVVRHWFEILNGSGIPYLVGGALAVYLHTGTWRDTKDLDVFLQARDLKKALDAFAREGYETKIHSPHWLAKITEGPFLLDLIFGFWNGRMKIDEEWIARGRGSEFAGVPVPLISLEDLIASKVYVASRDRFDGADIVHLIRGTEGDIDWSRVLALLGEDYPLLFWHLIFFDYVYPGHCPDLRGLMTDLFERIRQSWPAAQPSSYFRGPIVDPFSFKADMEEMGYADPRDMTPRVDEEGKLL
jgi:hypothetical protein